MSSPSSDRNLLLGVIALQLDFISSDGVLAAMHAWILKMSTPLGQILSECGDLDPDARALLEALVDKHLSMHDGNPQHSLSTLSGLGQAHADLLSLNDTDVQACLDSVMNFVPGGRRDSVAL